MDIVNLKNGEIIEVSDDLYDYLYNKGIIRHIKGYKPIIFLSRNKRKILLLKYIFDSYVFKLVKLFTFTFYKYQYEIYLAFFILLLFLMTVTMRIMSPSQ